MFQLGFYEILVVMLLGILLFDLKDFAHVCFIWGKTVQKIKRYYEEALSGLKHLQADLELEEIKKNAEKAAAKAHPLLEEKDPSSKPEKKKKT